MSNKRGHSAYTQGSTATWTLLPRGEIETAAHTTTPGPANGVTKHRLISRKGRQDENDNAGDSDGTSQKAVRPRKKAEPAKSACVQCQKRKTKCSGHRPTCRFCSDRDLACSYETTDGMTRTEDLKQKLQDANEKSEDLDILVDALRSGTDSNSTMLLARLRMGDSIEGLAKQLRFELSLTDAAHSPSETSNSQGTRRSSSLSGASPSSSSATDSTRKDSYASNGYQLPRTTVLPRPSKGPMNHSDNLHVSVNGDFDHPRMLWRSYDQTPHGLSQESNSSAADATRKDNYTSSMYQAPTRPRPSREKTYHSTNPHTSLPEDGNQSISQDTRAGGQQAFPRRGSDTVLWQHSPATSPAWSFPREY